MSKQKSRGQLNLKVVEVVWRDAWIDIDGYYTKEQLEQEPPFIVTHTAGFLIRSTPEVVSVALDYDVHSDTCRSVQHIPRENVISITTFSRAKTKGA